MTGRIGFIGCGNMGSAILKGLLAKRVVESSNVLVADKDEEKLKSISDETGVDVTTNSLDVIEKMEIIFLAVKPQDLEGLLHLLGPKAKDLLLISIAAGVKTDYIEGFTPNSRVVRLMPNTPALVFEMACSYCLGKTANENDEAVIIELISPLGKCVKVDEDLMDAVTGLSGSGPAYIYAIIDALTKAGVSQGIPEEKSLDLAVQTVKGAAMMVENTSKSPKELIDQVTSPGGTTVEGLKVLDDYNVGEAFVKAVEAATLRSKELSSK